MESVKGPALEIVSESATLMLTWHSIWKPLKVPLELQNPEMICILLSG